MQGSIAQSAALAVFGNSLLSGHAAENFWPEASVFAFCRSVKFVTLSGEASVPVESQFADDPIEWLAKLQSDGITGLRMSHFPQNDPDVSDWQSVGLVGGGGRWVIETVYGQESEFWEGIWRVGNQVDPDRKIWIVTYYRVGKRRPTVAPQLEALVSLRRLLGEALSDIEEFANRQKLDDFAKTFREAREVLNSATPRATVHDSGIVLSPETSLIARQLMTTAQSAWVFGGMGSWNDLGFDGADQDEYTELSDRLFSLLVLAVCGSVNSTFGDPV